MKDYYLILGIERNSSLAEIKAAYRKLSKKFHPDLNPDDIFFEERFKDIQNGYETLSVEKNRKAYDTKLNNSNFYRGNASGERAAENRFRQREQNIKSEEERLKKEKITFEKEKQNLQETFRRRRKRQSYTVRALGFTLMYAVLVTLILGKKLTNPARNQDASKPFSREETVLEKNSSDTRSAITYIPEPIPVAGNPELNSDKLNFDGIWLGKATQYDINESWEMKINIDTESNSYTITYPGLNCGGDLTLLDSINGKLEFREKITYGHNICNSGGKVVVENLEDRYFFFYYFPTDNVLNAKGEIFLSET